MGVQLLQLAVIASVEVQRYLIMEFAGIVVNSIPFGREAQPRASLLKGGIAVLRWWTSVQKTFLFPEILSDTAVIADQFYRKLISLLTI